MLPECSRLVVRQLTPEGVPSSRLYCLQSPLLCNHEAVLTWICAFFFFLNSNNWEGEEILCAAHCFRGGRMRWGRGARQVPTCHCGWSRWQQRCGCIPACGHGSVPGKPSQTLGMEPDHQNESGQTQNPHCSLSRCPLLWSKKSHLTSTKVHLPISFNISWPFQSGMPPPRSD